MYTSVIDIWYNQWIASSNKVWNPTTHWIQSWLPIRHRYTSKPWGALPSRWQIPQNQICSNETNQDLDLRIQIYEPRSSHRCGSRDVILCCGRRSAKCMPFTGKCAGSSSSISGMDFQCCFQCTVRGRASWFGDDEAILAALTADRPPELDRPSGSLWETRMSACRFHFEHS